MKKFFGYFREHAMVIILKRKNEVINKWKTEIIWKCKNLLYLRQRFEDKHAKNKKCCNGRDHCHYTGEYRGAANSICNLKRSAPKEVPIALYNESTYDYYFIIEVLAEVFERQVTCLG